MVTIMTFLWDTHSHNRVYVKWLKSIKKVPSHFCHGHLTWSKVPRQVSSWGEWGLFPSPRDISLGKWKSFFSLSSQLVGHWNTDLGPGHNDLSLPVNVLCFYSWRGETKQTNKQKKNQSPLCKSSWKVASLTCCAGFESWNQNQSPSKASYIGGKKKLC